MIVYTINLSACCDGVTVIKLNVLSAAEQADFYLPEHCGGWRAVSQERHSEAETPDWLDSRAEVRLVSQLC